MHDLDNDTISALVAAINDEHEDEQCAVIVRSGNTHSIHFVPNQHSDKKNHFRIIRKDVDPLLKDGGTLVAVIHTHTRAGQAEPSYDDVKSLPDGLLGIVVHPRSKSWTAFDNTVGVLAFHDGGKK